MTHNGNGRQGKTTITKSYSMLPEHAAAVQAHAKDAGLISESAGLRSIITEWQQFKAREAGLTES